MSRLQELQDTFQAALDDNPSRMNDHILATPRFPKEERLDIYVYGYTARLQEALVADFPKLNHYLGAKRFEALTAAFIADHPSMHPSLRWYGPEFSAWIAQSSGLKHASALAELAAFESLLYFAFDAEDCPILTMEQVSVLPSEAWPDLFLHAHPSVKLFHGEYNSVATWQQIDQNKKTKIWYYHWD